jgi:hypothetical protein
MKEFSLPRFRPIDRQGKRLPIAQSIVQAYSHIQQLLDDSRQVQRGAVNLALHTINNTTVKTW